MPEPMCYVALRGKNPIAAIVDQYDLRKVIAQWMKLCIEEGLSIQREPISYVHEYFALLGNTQLPLPMNGVAHAREPLAPVTSLADDEEEEKNPDA